MKDLGIRTAIAVRFALVVLIVIAAVSAVSNVLINREFEKYVEEKQRAQAEEIAQNMSYQYDNLSGQWNLDYIHGLGMYALSEGYIIKLYDDDKRILWDAENHDMTLCHQMMNSITLRMQETRPDVDGDFVTHRFDLGSGSEVIGYLDVSYYSPYYFNESDFNFITSLNKILAGVGIISLIGAVFTGIILANSIADPIVKTAEIAEKISHGDYTMRFKDKVQTKELLRLVQAVNQMAESLGKHESLQKRLTSDVAHELRTPISNVLSYLEAIAEGVWEPTPERLQKCYDELERIADLVSDLERLQQVEDENLKIQREKVDLFELGHTVSGNFETRLAEKKLSCTVSGEHAVVYADRGRIQQVLTNILSNAIKYSEENGRISIVVEDCESSASVSIADEGIGISKEDIDLIFERFYRADKSRNRKTGGAGIGLAIAKSIVQAHGGSIAAESEEGRGSIFTVTLPKSV